MKFLEKLTLIIYSDIMLIIAIILPLLIFGWLDYGVVSNLCYKALTTDVSAKIILVLSVIFILLSLKCIFFSSSDDEESSKKGIMLENESGKLLISQNTIENLVNSVAKSFESADSVSTRVALDKDNNLLVFVNLVVKQDAVIKDLSTKLQEKIKTTVKSSTDLDVKEVNIKIKNIAPKETEK